MQVEVGDQVDVAVYFPGKQAVRQIYVKEIYRRIFLE